MNEKNNPQISPITQIGREDSRTRAIIGAAMEVHGVLGSGFLEQVYHQALVLEMSNRGVLFRREVDLPIFYKGSRLEAAYRADFICYESVVVEIKAIGKLTTVEMAQVINYLKATGYEVGLLLNFGSPSLEYRRLALSRKSASSAKSADNLP